MLHIYALGSDNIKVSIIELLAIVRRWKRSRSFRANGVGPYINVQALSMNVVLMCSFELPFVAKVIIDRVRREGMRWKLS